MTISPLQPICLWCRRPIQLSWGADWEHAEPVFRFAPRMCLAGIEPKLAVPDSAAYLEALELLPAPAPVSPPHPGRNSD